MTRKDNNEKRNPLARLHSLTTTTTTTTTTTYVIALLLLLTASVMADDESVAPPSPYGFNTRFSPSMAIIIVILISAFFFMAFFSIYIRQCAGEGNGARQPNGQGRAGHSRRAARGLDPAVIQSFPTFVYAEVKGLKVGKGTLECAVCLSEFEDDETLRLLPMCSHVFHPDCIDAWLVSHTTCPVCRSNLVPGTSAAAAGAEPADLEAETELENPTGNDSANQVSIPIDELRPQDPIPPQANFCRIMPETMQNRPARTRSSRWSRFTGRFPRSHSTGHSILQTENYERYTLRLPESIRKQIMRGKLNRTISCVAFPSDGGSAYGSSRGGYRVGEGSSRGRNLQNSRSNSMAKSDQWTFSITPPFFSRNFSFNSPKVIEGEPTNSKYVGQAFLPYLRTPFDCVGAKPEAAEQSLAPSPTPAPFPVPNEAPVPIPAPAPPLPPALP